MLRPHDDILACFYDVGGRPIDEHPETREQRWAVEDPSAPHVPPLIIWLSGDGHDPSAIFHEVSRYFAVAKTYPKAQQRRARMNDWVYEVRIKLTFRESRVEDRGFVEYGPDDVFWVQYAFGALNVGWYDPAAWKSSASAVEGVFEMDPIPVSPDAFGAP